ncbi:MAG: MFS transporter [Actinobacteria bacterium]|nr:MFS transporter [Actinomycetota bacterium]
MAQRTPEARQLRKIALGSLAGTTLEYYDFILYGTTAGLIFGKLFFANFSGLVATMFAFATYAIGFISRPLGGLVFSHFGDRTGRKTMLIITVTLTGGVTVLIGLLPTYETIGILAPALLVTLRFAQGMGIGGEWGGAMLIMVEHAPAKRRGFYGSLPQTGAALGFVLSTAAIWLTTTLSSESAFLGWAWRLPFLFSAVMLAISLFIRFRVPESPLFSEVKRRQRRLKLPIAHLLRRHPKEFALTFAMYLSITPVSIVTVFLLFYIDRTLDVPRASVLLGIVCAHFLFIFLTIFGGVLSDKIGRGRVHIAGSVLMAVFAFPLFWLVDTGIMALIWIAIFIFAGGLWLQWGGMPAFYSELFPTEVRYTGLSISSQLSTALVNGTSPVVATAMLGATGGTWAISTYVIILCLASGAAAYLANSRRLHMQQVDQVVDQAQTAS